MVLALQGETAISTAERILEKFGGGWFVAFLFIIALIVVARKLWPKIDAYLSSLQRHADEAHDALRQVVAVQAARSADQERNFLSALTEQRDAHIQATQDQSKSIRGALEEVGGSITKQLQKHGDAIQELASTLKKEREGK